jgi:hypothetical protein
MAQTQRVTGVATSVRSDDAAITVRYHSTDVFRYDQHPGCAGMVTLRSGGWKTVTTKLRINQAFNQYGLDFGLYQARGEWFVWHRPSGRKVAFRDGMTFAADGGDL